MADLLDFAPVRVFTSNAAPGAGYIARFYQSGTTTPVTVYSDLALNTAWGSSVTANAEGVFPAVFSAGGAIKATIETPAGAVVATIDPVQSVASGAAAAESITFTPTVDLPFTNVQDAIEGAATTAATGFTPFGLGVTGSVPLLANLDATTIATGQYRFDNTTTGTFPTGLTAANTGAVEVIRETSGSAWMRLYHDTTDRLYVRRMNASTWGTWREEATFNQGAAAGDLFYHNGTNIIRLAKGTAGQLLRMNTGATAPEWGNGAITLGTAVASTSGTNIDFTGIPSTARRITVMLRGISTSGTSPYIIQVGNGSFVTTGYRGAASNNGTAANYTVGCGLAQNVGATSVFRAVCTIVNVTGNDWVFSGSGAFSDGATITTFANDISLGGALDRVRVTTVNGTDTFDLGTINIAWE